MLGAPPAFVLSQDQTLNLIILKLLYRSNKLFSEQLWRFVQIALLLWITCLDFQKKSGFSFIRIYCLIFKFLVKSHLISHSSYWRISSDSSIGKISLSWKAVSFVTALLLYHAVSFLSRGFLKFFEKVFWGSFQLLNKLFIALHKLFPSGLCIDTIFKLHSRSIRAFWVRVSRDSLSIIPPGEGFVNGFLRIWRDGQKRRNLEWEFVEMALYPSGKRSKKFRSSLFRNVSVHIVPRSGTQNIVQKEKVAVSGVL